MPRYFVNRTVGKKNLYFSKIFSFKYNDTACDITVCGNDANNPLIRLLSLSNCYLYGSCIYTTGSHYTTPATTKHCDSYQYT
ncbi:hypothetical protein ACFLW3_01040 [Chloroflexota bacterium]